MKNLITFVSLLLVVLLSSCDKENDPTPTYVGRDFKTGAWIETGANGNVKVWVDQPGNDINGSGANEEKQFNSLKDGLMWNHLLNHFIERIAGSDGTVFNEPLVAGNYVGYADNGKINADYKSAVFYFTVVEGNVLHLNVQLVKGNPLQAKYVPIASARKRM